MVRLLVKKAIALGLVNEDNAEIYEYGVTDMLYSLFTCGVFLFVGLCINMFWQVLLFTLVHIPFRTYAGGLHFATRFRCFFASVTVFAIVFALPHFFTAIQLANAISWLLIPSIFLTWQLAPVEEIRKPLNPKEKKHYSKTSLNIAFTASALVVTSCVIKRYQAAYFAGAAIILVAVQLALGLIKNKHERGL